VSISTHVLDAVAGAPARGVAVRLERVEGSGTVEIAGADTDTDGRCPALTDGLQLETGTYQLRFETGAYFAGSGTATFYPVVVLVFAVTDPSAHYHVPLLLSPFAYSTYRGS
jgi:5-hydroxyisourate hydrolase